MPCAFHAERPSPFANLSPDCQFSVPEEKLMMVNGQPWCSYHCPMIDKEGNPTEKAAWDEAQLQVFHDELDRLVTGALEQEGILDFTGVVFPVAVTYDTLPSVSFYRAIFGGDAGFGKATFSGDARFGQATFSEGAGFEKAIFGGDAWFGSSGDIQGEEKLKANVFHYADFTAASFASDVSFMNRRFLRPAVFSECTFETAPKFHGCTLHQGSVFPPRGNFKDVTSKGGAQAYRTLKLAMEQVRARREEGMFYALEQESRRHQPDTPLSEKLVSYLYQWTANFGESFLRPLGCLLLITVGFFLLCGYCIVPDRCVVESYVGMFLFYNGTTCQTI